MWSSRLFWKLFLAYSIMTGVSALAIGLTVAHWQSDRLLEQVDERLHDSATILATQLADEFPGEPSPPLQRSIREMGRRTHVRLTLVAVDGQVLADSDRPDLEAVRRMDNHGDRPEIKGAVQTGAGRSRRHSTTLGIPMMYYAARVGRSGQLQGVVRAALPVATVQAQLRTVQRLAAGVATGIGLLVVFLTYWVVAQIIRPVAMLNEAAQSIAAGNYDPRLNIAQRDELGDLGESFNLMCRQMTLRVSELRESGERLGTVLGAMVEGVLAVDDRQRVLFANQAAGQLLGFSVPSATGRPLLESIRNHRLHQAVQETLTGGSRSLELTINEKPESVLSVHSTQLPGDPCPGVVLVLHNVTELRRLESVRQEFVANVSHELKTPLSAIKAYAETLQQGAIEDPQNRGRFLAQISEQAERLHQLILDLLRLARIESGQQAFDIASISIRSGVDDCLKQQRAAADAKQIRLVCQPADGELLVRADEEGLRQILGNLVDNAIKYTPAGGEVRVSWFSRDGQAIIEVADTGIGIPENQWHRVFERFYRVDKARSRELGGTGLGLSIVKHLAQSFGGSVSVQSVPGQGSTFQVRLPRG